ncbi:MAG: hypothetical protein AAGD35_19780 [Actinomycetota bacterium]
MKIKFPKALMGTAAVAMVATAAVAAPALADDQQEPAKQQATVTAQVTAQDIADEGGVVADIEALSLDDLDISPECEAVYESLDEAWGDDLTMDGEGLDVDGEFAVEDWEPTADEVDAMNAETDAMVAFLAEKGHEVSVETDEYGLRYPVLDDLFETLSDEELDALLEEFFTQHYGDDVGGLIGATDEVEGELTDGTVITEDGVIVDDIEGLDLEDLDELDVEMLGDDLTDIEEWEPTAEELEAINAETDAMVAALAEQGIEVAVETDDDGFRYPVLDGLTDEQVDEIIAAIDVFYEAEYHAEMAELGVDVEALEACDEALFGEFDDVDEDLLTEAVPFEEDADA